MSKRLTKSGYRGVEKNNKSGWQARICTGPRSNRKRVNLGTYTTPEAAAEAYDDAAFELHGKDTILNFPSRSPRIRMRSLEANAANCATPEEPAPLPIPRSDPASAPERVAEGLPIPAQGCVGCGRSLYDGDHCAAFPACPCCPRCGSGSNLYGEVGGGFRCRACGAQ